MNHARFIRPVRALFLIITGALMAVPAAIAEDGDSSPSNRKKVILIAGRKSHGPENNGIHDYPWMVRYLKMALEKSDLADSVDVSIHFEDWPASGEAFDDADTILFVSDGRDGDNGREVPHLASQERVALMDRLMDRGCGIVVIHFSTFAPDQYADRVLQWHGGYFDWETDGRREWYSQIQTVDALVRPSDSGHQTLRGLEPFTMNEEFYFDIRFPDDPDWSPVLEVPSLPAKKPHGTVVSWAIERDNGGRGYGTTCGHFYENFAIESFRKSILNAIVWTAGLEVPRNGVKAGFYSMDQVGEYLAGAERGEAERRDSDDGDFYADRPYWYQPGHPVNPAEPAGIRTLPGFVVEKVYQVPAETGSVTALTADDKGNLLFATQHRRGIWRLTPASLEGDGSETRVEMLGGDAAEFGWAHGLLYFDGNLYVTVSEGNDTIETGVYRLVDRNADGEMDSSQLLVGLKGAGEHGPHQIVPDPEGEFLYMISGNGSPLPEKVEFRHPVSTTGIDHLMPPAFDSSSHTDAGWVCRFHPDGSDWELIASGLRNSYDLAFNHHGDLFTFDSDMEWDLGAPWYRPTRICHLVDGAEFGWRGDAAKWPAYFPDSVPPVVNIGPGSPTGVTFGYGARFPEKYRNAMFACDWTFATIHAVHLIPEGSGYRAEVEEFVGGSGLPVTDAVVASDGHFYFSVGGRHLGSAIYRVRFTGDPEQITAVSDQKKVDSPEPATNLHRLRMELADLLVETRSRDTSKALRFALEYLSHEDAGIRYAARIVLEKLPVDMWREKVIDGGHGLLGKLALARQGSPDDLKNLLSQIVESDPSKLSDDTRSLLTLLRTLEMAFARGEDSLASFREPVRKVLFPLFPSGNADVDRELIRLLCFLGERRMIPLLLDRMEADTGTRQVPGADYFTRNSKYGQAVQDILLSAPRVERMHCAQMLLWLDDGWEIDQRKRYFSLISDAMRNSQGGHTYREIWERIREVALDQSPGPWREALRAIDVPPAYLADMENVPSPTGPGREWSLPEIMELIDNRFTGRNFEHGRAMYAATGCVQCHRMDGSGGTMGPDLTALGRRFTLRDVTEAILKPNLAISDQYMMTVIETRQGQTLAGRIISRDNESIRIATDMLKPAFSTTVPIGEIAVESRLPVSTMPGGLLNSLNADEVLDLLAYLYSGANPDHPVFNP